MRRLRQTVAIIQRTIEVYSKHDMYVYSGYTTFYFLMSVVPLLMLIISVINLLPWFSVEQVSTILSKIIPDIPQIRRVLLSVVINLNRQSGQLVSYLFALTSFWSGSHGVSAMMTGLEKINHTDQKTVKNRIKAIFYTVLYTLLIPSMLLFQGIRASLKNGVKALFSYLNITFNVADMSGHAITIIRLSEIVTLAMMILVIVLTFTYLPSGDRKIRSQLPGSIFTSVLWILFTKAFGFFIQRFWRYSSVYGALAAVFLAAMWMKFIISILFYGASLNRALQVKVSKDCQT
ncbi:MAG: YihY/virulence factor BrkB family protein [Lachnospiraceae bacterium]|nr:YihY/virulence factor BrkB family protein [Lachnospiraceae bacterium]